MQTQKFIAYYRVSTKMQGNSGLGLEGQSKAVENYTNSKGTVIASFTDIESGKNDNRVELSKAIDLCKKENAILVIAKLDRLSRNLTFISSLMNNKIQFVCCDMPTANEFTIHIFAALAQQERKMISERTKAALQAKKAQGIKLGTKENLTVAGQKKAVASIKNKAAENTNNMQAKSKVKDMLQLGFSFAKILAALQKNKFLTSSGKAFTQIIQVQRLAK